MTGYEIYSFILSLIVLILLASIFVVFLRVLIKFYLRLVRSGLEDEALLSEARNDGTAGVWDVINNISSVLVCAVMIIAFVFSMYVQITENAHPFGLPSLSVVKSSSMSYRDESNTYLYTNNIDNQFDMFDIIVVDPLPNEYELELYDVVVYETKDGTPIVHRIVGIEEPNEAHSDCRHFKLQGDAVSLNDKYPVLYSQMKGIYANKKIPFIGSFVAFMQSPAGWICILTVLFAIIATPVVERKISREKQARLSIICKVETPSEDICNKGDSTADLFAKYCKSRKLDVRKFYQHLCSADEKTREYYVRVSEYLYSIEDVKYGYSEKYQTFRINGRVLARLTVRSGVLCAYVNAVDISPSDMGVYTVNGNPSFSDCNVKIVLNTDENVQLLETSLQAFLECVI